MTKLPAKQQQLPSKAPPTLTGDEYRRTIVLDQALVPTDAGLQFAAGSPEPTLAERRWLEQRQAIVVRSVNGRDAGRIFEALAAMFAAMGTYSGTSDDAAFRVQECARMLNDMPPWAVEQACEIWATGGYGIDHRAPTSAELHAKVRLIVEPLWKELERIARITKALPAPLPDEVDKARVDDIVARFKAKVAQDAAETSGGATWKAQHDAWLEANDERLRETERVHKAAVEARRRAESFPEDRG